MDLLDKLLSKRGLKWEDLTPEEREYASQLVNSVQKAQITVEDIRSFISASRDTLILEVSKHDTGSKEDLLIKARIRNYTMLLGFLSGPEKAKKALENAIAGAVG